MKNKKNILIALVMVIALILILVLCVSCQRNKTPNNLTGAEVNIAPNAYIEEFDTEKFSWRVLEAETKEYVTLFIETRLFEGKEKIDVMFDSSKYILDRANPIVEKVIAEDAEGYEGKKSFKLELDSITNYSVDFIKKNPTSIPSVEDIDVN